MREGQAVILIRDIQMFKMVTGWYRVTIRGEGGSAQGDGATPYDAYRNAESRLVVKPACEWMKE